MIESARALGDTFVLDHLWRKLGLQLALRGALGSRRAGHEPLIRAMVLHRLCDPGSKLGTLRWLEGAVIPGVQTPSHAALLRAMDALEDTADVVESRVLDALRPLLDQDLSVVFYDLTTIRAEGESEMVDDLRAVGHSKDRDLPSRLVVVGVVQSACGLPLLHTVHKGNIAETATLLTMVRTLKDKLPIKRLVLVADRGLMSTDNLLVIATSVSETHMTAERVVERYRALADIETGFKVLKNEIEMAPMFHRLPARIVAHGAICFLALVLNCSPNSNYPCPVNQTSQSSLCSVTLHFANQSLRAVGDELGGFRRAPE